MLPCELFHITEPNILSFSAYSDRSSGKIVHIEDKHSSQTLSQLITSLNPETSRNSSVSVQSSQSTVVKNISQDARSISFDDSIWL